MATWRLCLGCWVLMCFGLGCEEPKKRTAAVPTSAKSGPLMVYSLEEKACARMCRHVSDCHAAMNGMQPEAIRGSEIERNLFNECIYGCVGKKSAAEVACWTSAPCEKAGTTQALSGVCLAPKPKPKPKPKPAPPPKPAGPSCETVCAHVTACARVRPKGLTAAELQAECAFRCEGLEPDVRACYLSSPCIDLPKLPVMNNQSCVGMASRRCVDHKECLSEGKCTLRTKYGRSECRTESKSVELSLMCTEKGACGAVPRRVTYGPRSHRDCTEADICREEGLCRQGKVGFNGRYCEASNRGCAKSKVCAKEGNCGTHPKWSHCVATRGGCARSEACKKDGLCGAAKTKAYRRGLKHLRCIATQGGCQRSEGCKTRGACQLQKDSRGPGGCIARSIADCRKICGGMSDCTFVFSGGYCVPRSTNACRARYGGGEGTWAFEDGKCAPRSDADCAALPPCAKEGKCSYQDGQCVLLKDADCAQRIEQRRESVRARFVDRKFNICAEEGRCALEDGQCVPSEKGCRASRLCREQGLCSLGPKGCQAASDADCAQSSRCERNGTCMAKNGVCRLRCGNGPKSRTCER